MICYLFPEPLYFLFTSSVPALLYYSYIPVTAASLIVGFYVFLNGKKLLLNRLFLAISLCFSLFTISVLIEWTNIHSDFILFVWSFQGEIFGLIAIFCIYFIYVFLDKKDISTRLKIILLSLVTPVFILAPTNFNLSGFNITNCDAFQFEWLPFKLYYAFLGVLAIIWIFILLIRRYRVAVPDFKKQIVLMGTGIESFLFLFFIWTSLMYYLTQIGMLADSRLEMYGMFGMVIFIIYISILMVRFKAFNTKLFATQALVWGLVALIGSQFFFIKVLINFILTAVTFLGVLIFGQLLIKSVKKEIEQKEKLQALTIQLEENNEKLKAFDVLKSKFLSLASHQLRNPISTIMACVSMFLDNSFGPTSDLQKKMLNQMLHEAQDMNASVEKYLTIAKIEQGGLQYNLEKLDLSVLANDITERQKIEAEKRNLTLTFETDNRLPYYVSGDNIQLKQVLHNLIDNSMKYTKEGWIKVKVSKDETAGKIRLAVSDSGMGIKPEIMPELFKEFSRGEGAKVDVMGSGIGLYLVKEIIEKGHNGKIWAESQGAGKGSTFIAELPVYKETTIS